MVQIVKPEEETHGGPGQRLLTNVVRGSGEGRTGDEVPAVLALQRERQQAGSVQPPQVSRTGRESSTHSR